MMCQKKALLILKKQLFFLLRLEYIIPIPPPSEQLSKQSNCTGHQVQEIYAYMVSKYLVNGEGKLSIIVIKHFERFEEKTFLSKRVIGGFRG